MCIFALESPIFLESVSWNMRKSEKDLPDRYSRFISQTSRNPVLHGVVSLIVNVFRTCRTNKFVFVMLLERVISMSLEVAYRCAHRHFSGVILVNYLCGWRFTVLHRAWRKPKQLWNRTAGSFRPIFLSRGFRAVMERINDVLCIPHHVRK